MGAVTVVGVFLVGRTPAVSTRKASKDRVLFVVSTRRAPRVFMRIVGIFIIAAGSMNILVSSTLSQESPAMAIAGFVMIPTGLFFVWFAHGMARMHLEVTEDVIWVFRVMGKPRQVLLSSISRFEPHVRHNFGGILAYSGPRLLFYATRVMAGYPQLIDFLRQSRPDLRIPPGSRPLGAR